MITKLKPKEAYLFWHKRIDEGLFSSSVLERLASCLLSPLDSSDKVVLGSLSKNLVEATDNIKNPVLVNELKCIYS